MGARLIEVSLYKRKSVTQQQSFPCRPSTMVWKGRRRLILHYRDFFFHNTHIPNFCHLSPEYCFLSQYRISYRVTATRWKAIEREEKGHFGCLRSAKGARGRRSRAQIPFLLAFESSVTPCESARALQVNFRYSLWSAGQYTKLLRVPL